MKILFVFPGRDYKCYEDFIKYTVVGIGYRIKKDLSGMEDDKRKKEISSVVSKRKNYKPQGLKTQVSRINSFFDKSLQFGIIPVKGSKELMLVKLDSKVYYSKNKISELTHYRDFKLIKILENNGNYSNNVGVCRVSSKKIKGLESEIKNFEKKSNPKISELINDDELYGYEGEIKRQLKNHKNIERDKSFSRKYRIKYNGIKSCPACSFNGKKKYRLSDANTILEMHHIVPLKFSKGKKKISEKNVSFLCPNCHRAIHKMMAEDQLKTISIKEFKKKIK